LEIKLLTYLLIHSSYTVFAQRFDSFKTLHYSTNTRSHFDYEALFQMMLTRTGTHFTKSYEALPVQSLVQERTPESFVVHRDLRGNWA